MFAVAVRRFADLVVLDITANAFLQHMVRNIAGRCFRWVVATKPVTWVKEVLLARNRDLVGATAPPDGLYLVDVQYGAVELPRAQPPLILRALGDVW